MVRSARREEFEIHGEPIGGMTPVHTEHFVVAGCNTDALGGNRVPASCRCIADQCAMWRDVIQLHACDQPPPAPRGYCGLAGRPQ